VGWRMTYTGVFTFDIKEYLEDQNQLAVLEQKYHDYIAKDPEFRREAVERLAKSYSKVFELLKSENHADIEEKTRAVMRDTFGDVYGGLEKLVIRNHNKKGGE